MKTTTHTMRATAQGSGERGASLIQFVLVLPLLLLIVAYIIDISVYLAVESLLDEAANRTLARAITVSNLDIDPDGKPASDHEFRRYLLAREKANQEGVDFLRSVKIVDASLDQAEAGLRRSLLPVVFVEDRHSGPAITKRFGVLTLLPGECARIERMDRVECNRETLGTSAADAPPEQPMRFLLERHPIKVIAVARVDSYLPFGTPKFAMATTHGYREAVPRGPFAAWEDPQLLAEGPPLPFTKPEVETLGPPRMPDDEPFTVCVPNWTVCMARSQKQGRTLKPINRLSGDGVNCDCD